MNENMEFPGATEADINWLQDCFVQCLKDKVVCVQGHHCSRSLLFKAMIVEPLSNLNDWFLGIGCMVKDGGMCLLFTIKYISLALFQTLLIAL